MPRPKKYDDALRRTLLAAAAEAIAAHGADALALRPLAEAAGTSTNAIYSIFGSRSGLVDAVLGEAADSFTAAQRAALNGADPLTDLAVLGSAYRDWARAHPALYSVMFGDRVRPEPGLPSPDPCPDAAMEPLLEAVGRAMVAGVLRPGDRLLVATSIWASIHGLVSLEAAGRLGHVPPMAELFDEHLNAIVAYWLADPGLLTPR